MDVWMHFSILLQINYFMCIGMKTILLQEYDNQQTERSRFMNKYRTPNNQKKNQKQIWRKSKKLLIKFLVFFSLFFLFLFHNNIQNQIAIGNICEIQIDPKQTNKPKKKSKKKTKQSKQFAFCYAFKIDSGSSHSKPWSTWY